MLTLYTIIMEFKIFRNNIYVFIDISKLGFDVWIRLK